MRETLESILDLACAVTMAGALFWVVCYGLDVIHY
jgi:hypothetical protein